MVWSEPVKPQTELIAIDPGDRWTGVAFFATDEDGAWYCQDADEFEAPSTFEDALADLILMSREEPPPIIVYEKWRLYADHAREQTGSEFEASQHIGVIKYLVRVHNDHVDRHERAEAEGKMMTCELQGGICEDPKVRPQRITIVKQPADIKKPTAGILRTKKIKSVAKPIARELYSGRDHIVDAELHGWHHILRTMGGRHAD
jgi:hypothetical protein